MPWKECHVMDERLRFVARLLEGEKMAPLCAEFGISRKTGYKKVPADLYTRSPRVYRGLEELTYPFHDQTIMVTGCGRICFRGRKVNLRHVFAGQSVGVTQVGERIWLVTFMQYDLGYFDETCRLEPIAPIRPETVTHPLGINCHPSDQNGPLRGGSSGWTRTSNPPVNSRMLCH